jgi:choline dehydrogenase
MRSGVGNAELCRSLGIAPVIDLPGVGENLVDHPAVMMWMVPRPGVCREGEPYHQVLARAASRPGGPCDLAFFMLSSMVTSQLPMLTDLLRAPLAAAISVMLARPDSRGRVFLQSKDPEAKPVIDLNLGSDPRDVERLAQGVRQAWAIARHPAIADRTASVFMWNEGIIKSDALLQRAISRFVNGAWHPVGSARMGAAGDRGAVADPRCRVHGLEGLRVVDASVMPAIPSVPTGLTCLMIAERAAEWMAGEEQ